MGELLLVDDCPETGVAVERALGRGFRVRHAASLAQAEDLLERCEFDLVLLDLSLPDGDGLRLCSRLQEDPDTADVPILFLSATRDVRTKVMALTLGADDWIEKPFAAEELRARVESRLRKRAAARERDQVLRRGVVTIHVASQRVTVEDPAGTREVTLTATEFRLLHRLACQPGHVLARERLMSLVWGDTVVTERTIDSHLSNLRRKLGPGAGACVEAVRGAGYRFVPR